MEDLSVMKAPPPKIIKNLDGTTTKIYIGWYKPSLQNTYLSIIIFCLCLYLMIITTFIEPNEKLLFSITLNEFIKVKKI